MNNGDLFFVLRRRGHVPNVRKVICFLSVPVIKVCGHTCAHTFTCTLVPRAVWHAITSANPDAHTHRVGRTMIAQASKQPFKCQSKCYLTGLIVKHTGSFNNAQINKSTLQEEAGAINYLIAALSGFVHRMMYGKSWFTLKDILQTSFVTHTSSCALIH